MPVAFDIPLQAYQELADLVALSGRLKEIQKSLPNEPSDQQPKIDAVAQELGIDPQKLRAALRGLGSLASLVRGSKLSPPDLFERITESIEIGAPTDWKDKNFDSWKSAKDLIVEAVSRNTSNEYLNAQRKTRELTYLYDNIFKSCRLLTEIRPVFNEPGDKVVNNVLVTSLVVKYAEADKTPKQVTFALDLEDLIDLRSHCERAIRKIAVVEQMFKESGRRLTVAGQAKQENIE